MLTVDDIKKLTQGFATKQDLEKFVTKEEFHERMDSVLDKMDSVYGEVVRMREEQSLHAQRHDDIEKELRAHSKRLEKIESIPSIAHEIKGK